MNRVILTFAKVIPWILLLTFVATGFGRPPVVEMNRSGKPPVAVVNPGIVKVVQAEGMKGKSCGSEPTLTDTVVFEFTDGRVSVVTFDEAWSSAKSGNGYVRAYCV